MKNASFSLALILLTFSALPAHATAPAPTVVPQAPGKTDGALPVTSQQANKYYTSCTSGPLALANIDPVGRGLTCACVAAGLQAEMTGDEYKIMNKLDDAKGRAAFLKMVEKVYLPCATQPLVNYVREDCKKRAGRNYVGGNPQIGCQCVAARMNKYIRDLGLEQIKYNITGGNALRDPLDILTGGSGYRRELLRSYPECFEGAAP